MSEKEKIKKEFKEAVERVAKSVPKCRLEFRDGKAVIVCQSKADQKEAYDMVATGILIEVKEPKVEISE